MQLQSDSYIDRGKSYRKTKTNEGFKQAIPLFCYLLFLVCLMSCASYEPVLSTTNRCDPPPVPDPTPLIQHSAQSRLRYTLTKDGSKTLTLGLPLKSVENLLGEKDKINCEDFVTDYSRRLAFLKEMPKVAVWLQDASTLETQGGKTYLIAVFDNEDILIDVLLFRARMRLWPVLDGVYNQRLETISKGDSVKDIYKSLGEKNPLSYYETTNGAWRVDLSYPGLRDESWVYRIHAGSGMVEDVVFSRL